MKEELKQEQENCCTPVGQIKRYVDCHGCDRKPKQEQENSEDFGLPKFGTKEFNNLASSLFGGKPKQERMYSEIELEVAFFEGRENNLSFIEWFEQFKKK